MRSIVCALASAAALATTPAYSAQDTAAGSQKSDKSNAQSDARGGKASAAGPSVVLFPPLLIVDAKFSGGCWARFHGDQNFKGDALTLAGAGDYTNLKTSLVKIARKWDSVEVGPKATVTAYDNDDFTQPVATFKASQRLADLDDKLGFFDNIRSVRMTCAK